MADYAHVLDNSRSLATGLHGHSCKMLMSEWNVVKEELRWTRSNLSTLLSQVSTLQAQMHDLNDYKVGLGKHLKQLNSLHAQHSAVADSLRSDICVLQSALDVERRERRDSTSSMEATMEELKDSVSEVEEEVARFELQKQAMTRDISRLQSRLEHVPGELARVSQRLEQLDEVSTLQAEMHDLKDYTVGLGKHLKQLNSLHDEHSAVANSLRRDIDVLRSALDIERLARRDSVSSIEGTMGEIKDSVSEVEKEVARFELQKQAMTLDISRMRSHLDDVDVDVSQRLERLEQVGSWMSSISHSFESFLERRTYMFRVSAMRSILQIPRTNYFWRDMMCALSILHQSVLIGSRCDLFRLHYLHRFI
eukprot:TRINITY_DN5236_c0_g1_i1.p1 TRINITY_DN5236_c0_g1~~TRINITY_DN5236_c0_g1_i1.p1  ORF type:complete len:365 (-),score=69.35 TRINITY_DN5236_c0_g1_i1:142-1236(-)